MKKVIYHILTFLMDREKLLSILTRKEEKELLAFTKEGYLYDTGWTNSMVGRQVVDRENKPLPWVTYPFISFIAPLLQPEFNVFEFGSGNSTLFYAERTAAVDSVEHDEAWYEKMKAVMPVNVNLFYCALVKGGDYCRYASETGKTYDLVMVDGRDRVNCIKNSISCLTPGGVLILDDSERDKYAAGVSFLKDAGFKKIDFWGMAPAVNYQKCTSVFYRGNNCLGI
jgi:hypothetical protein